MLSTDKVGKVWKNADKNFCQHNIAFGKRMNEGHVEWCYWIYLIELPQAGYSALTDKALFHCDLDCKHTGWYNKVSTTLFHCK